MRRYTDSVFLPFARKFTSATDDKVGNIKTKTHLGTTSANTYNYPNPQQPQPFAVSNLTRGGSTVRSFTYDNNGNLLTDTNAGVTRNVDWTQFNKVGPIRQGATTLASYTYDAEHQRVKQVAGGTTVKYYNDPVTGVSAERYSSPADTWHDYLFAEGQRIAVRMRTVSSGAITWQVYIHDNQDSVAVVTNIAGAVTQQLSYDAWGKRRNPNGTDSRFAMTQEKDYKIGALLAALPMAARGWIVIDNWEADLSAIGIAKEGQPRRLVYVSTFGKQPGCFDFACEAPNGASQDDYMIINQGQDVDLPTLQGVIEKHLGHSH